MKAKIIYYSIALVVFVILWRLAAYLVNFLPISPLTNIISMIVIIVIIVPLSLICAEKIIKIVKNSNL